MTILSNPKVSVIIPCYNHSRFIEKAIESVLFQTYRDFELIIADDASQDDSADKISKYIAKDERIGFFPFRENMGAAFITNFLIKESKGEYIAILNSDDLWEPEKLQAQVDILDKNKDFGAVFTNATFINENDKCFDKHTFKWTKTFEQQNRTSGKWLRKFFFDLNCLCHPSILIRKEIYNRTSLYNPCLKQLPDFAMWIDILKSTSIFIDSRELVKYRVLTSSENASAVTATNYTRNINEVFFIMRDFFSKIPLGVFMDGFGDICINKGDLGKDQLLCEQAFLYFKVKSDIDYIYKLIGMEKFFALLQNKTTKDILQNVYNFSERDFLKLSGSCKVNNYTSISFKNRFIWEIKKKIRMNYGLYLTLKYLHNLLTTKKN